ncbi:MAG TPA: polyprenyl synthetase family protein, partial [Gemmatimonadaceae bacterium]|nr:polyprenyl synthetase family protein [Gemmatimonadaceae bacterium]
MISEVETVGAALAEDRRAVDAALVRCCERDLAPLPADVADAIRYSLLGGGKRLRAVLVAGAYRAAGGEGDPAGLAAAVEIVHAYSLVHDDLPCMDDDDVRRGRPTVHRVHGVAVATAAGLAMVPRAARRAAAAARELGLDEGEVGEVVRTLMRASGAAGMIGGQLLDLQGEGRSLTLPELERIHRHKTGALIAAAVRLGGL